MFRYERSEIYYYPYKGEVNTEHVLQVAMEAGVREGIKNLVIATETGRSVLKALEIMDRFDFKFKLIAVTHPPDTTWGPKGDIPIGLNHPRYKPIKKCLEEKGVLIIQAGRAFASASRSIGWDAPHPDTYIDRVLGIFGQGVKIAIEASLLATDAGALNRGDIVISLGGTFKGLDSAIISKTTYSYYFLSEYEVLKIIAKPLYPRIKLPEYEDPNWKGDLQKYYEDLDRKV